jgi:hypothetical protein
MILSPQTPLSEGLSLLFHIWRGLRKEEAKEKGRKAQHPVTEVVCF